jgi:glycosyltransferase involved in cell wall biosynthesis
MSLREEPLVSVLTPVYNGEAFLAECIESVFAQTYKNFEYIIVNNYSTDRSLDIALAYAKQDPRVQVHNNNTFVDIIANHNIAFSLMSSGAKYCKVVSADDALFPDCMMRMVELAEANPSAGFIGCYQLRGQHIRWQGFPYPKVLLTGRDVCRQILLGGDHSFGFGSPTSLLYRADLVRKTRTFYPNASPHADTSACFEHLKDCDFAFVYQVLCWERTHEATQSSKSEEINDYLSAVLDDIVQYGKYYLNREEYEKKLKQHLNGYHQFLAVNMIAHRGKEFWDYHKSRLKELGYPMETSALLKAGMVKVFKEIVNPQQAIRKSQRLRTRSTQGKFSDGVHYDCHDGHYFR